MRSLAPLFPEKSNLQEPIGEVWLTGIDCKVASGPFAGKTLGEAWREMPPEWRGTRFAEPGDFPILIKFIFPNDKLSIQVHPDDAYAAVHEREAGGRGKTEMWHVISAEPGASLLVGLKPEVTKESFLKAIKNQTLEDLFQRHSVQTGDTYFVPACTPHTIGPGMVICEVQEYSDLTYRVYDYGRLDAKGKSRELHIEKALQVLNFDGGQRFKTRCLPIEREGMDLAVDETGGSLLTACKYFAVAKWDISRPQKRYSGDMESSFSLLVFASGGGQLVWREGRSTYDAGECWFVPAEFEECSLVPSRPTSILEAYVPEVPLLLNRLKRQGADEDSLSQTVFP
jgi:mannose-6-phosphate isomerase